MAACTLTSRALVGSSHTTTRGSPAKARAMATRCFRPPESWRGLRSRWRGERRRADASSATRSSAFLPLTPVSLTTDRFRMRRTVQLRLSAESGFWKTIWMARLVAAGRSALLPAMASPSSVTSLPASGAWMPEHGLGQRRLARARLADQPERLAVIHAEVHTDQGRDRPARLLEGLGHVVHAQHDAVLGGGLRPGPGRRVGDLPEAVGVVAQAVAALADVDAGWRDGAALLGGEGAAVDVDAGRQGRPDLGQRAGDGEQGLLVLADAVAGQAAQEPDGVRVLGVVEDLVAPALARRSARHT